MNKRLSGRERGLLILVILIALGFLGWKFAYTPVESYINELKAEEERLEAETARLLAISRQITALEDQWQAVEWERERLSLVLPAEDQLPLVLGNLDRLIDHHAVEMKSLHTAGFNAAEGSDHKSITFRGRFEGKEGSLLFFLAGLEKFTHLVITREVNWQRGETSDMEIVFDLIFHE